MSKYPVTDPKAGLSLINWDTDPPTEHFGPAAILEALAEAGVLADETSHTQTGVDDFETFTRYVSPWKEAE